MAQPPLTHYLCLQHMRLWTFLAVLLLQYAPVGSDVFFVIDTPQNSNCGFYREVVSALEQVCLHCSSASSLWAESCS